MNPRFLAFHSFPNHRVPVCPSLDVLIAGRSRARSRACSRVSCARACVCVLHLQLAAAIRGPQSVKPLRALAMIAAVPALLVSLVTRSNTHGEGLIGGASADPTSINAASDCDGEVSYNGICTPASFPPRQNYSRAVPHPPYLDNPPALIDITVGRQLFVDSFLIANSSGTVQQEFHAAKYHDENPVLKPDQPWEGTFAMPFSGGAWWEDKEDRLALWYRCGGGYASQSEGESSSSDHSGPTTTGTCLAYSSDGVHFSKPLQDVVPNTNFVRQVAFDGNTVWLDRSERNASRRYKMADVDAAQSYAHYTLLASPDGVRLVLHLSLHLCSPMCSYLLIYVRGFGSHAGPGVVTRCIGRPSLIARKAPSAIVRVCFTTLSVKSGFFRSRRISTLVLDAPVGTGRAHHCSLTRVGSKTVQAVRGMHRAMCTRGRGQM